MAGVIQISGTDPMVGLSTVTRAWLQEDMTKMFGKVVNVRKPPTTGEPEKDVAFIHFARREDAEKAAESLRHGMVVGNGCPVIGDIKGSGKGGSGGGGKGGRNWQSEAPAEDSRKIAQQIGRATRRSRSRSRRRREDSRSRSRRRRENSRSGGRSTNRKDSERHGRSRSRSRSRMRRDEGRSDGQAAAVATFHGATEKNGRGESRMHDTRKDENRRDESRRDESRKDDRREVPRLEDVSLANTEVAETATSMFEQLARRLLMGQANQKQV